MPEVGTLGPEGLGLSNLPIFNFSSPFGLSPLLGGTNFQSNIGQSAFPGTNFNIGGGISGIPSGLFSGGSIPSFGTDFGAISPLSSVENLPIFTQPPPSIPDLVLSGGGPVTTGGLNTSSFEGVEGVFKTPDGFATVKGDTLSFLDASGEPVKTTVNGVEQDKTFTSSSEAIAGITSSLEQIDNPALTGTAPETQQDRTGNIGLELFGQNILSVDPTTGKFDFFDGESGIQPTRTIGEINLGAGIDDPFASFKPIPTDPVIDPGIFGDRQVGTINTELVNNQTISNILSGIPTPTQSGIQPGTQPVTQPTTVGAQVNQGQIDSVLTGVPLPVPVTTDQPQVGISELIRTGALTDREGEPIERRITQQPVVQPTPPPIVQDPVTPTLVEPTVTEPEPGITPTIAPIIDTVVDVLGDEPDPVIAPEPTPVVPIVSPTPPTTVEPTPVTQEPDDSGIDIPAIIGAGTIISDILQPGGDDVANGNILDTILGAAGDFASSQGGNIVSTLIEAGVTNEGIQRVAEIEAQANREALAAATGQREEAISLLEPFRQSGLTQIPAAAEGAGEFQLENLAGLPTTGTALPALQPGVTDIRGGVPGLETNVPGAIPLNLTGEAPGQADVFNAQDPVLQRLIADVTKQVENRAAAGGRAGAGGTDIELTQRITDTILGRGADIANIQATQERTRLAGLNQRFGESVVQNELQNATAQLDFIQRQVARGELTREQADLEEREFRNSLATRLSLSGEDAQAFTQALNTRQQQVSEQVGTEALNFDQILSLLSQGQSAAQVQAGGAPSQAQLLSNLITGGGTSAAQAAGGQTATVTGGISEIFDILAA